MDFMVPFELGSGNFPCQKFKLERPLKTNFDLESQNNLTNPNFKIQDG